MLGLTGTMSRPGTLTAVAYPLNGRDFVLNPSCHNTNRFGIAPSTFQYRLGFGRGETVPMEKLLRFFCYPAH
jgi:hypothetical protein